MKPRKTQALSGLAAALLTAAIVGCAGTPANTPVPLSPRTLTEVQRSVPSRATEASRPTVALALGGST